MSLCTVKGETPPEYFSPTQAEVAANMLIYEETDPSSGFLQVRFNFNTEFMPSWITGKTIKYTARIDFVGHPAGTSWTSVYNPAESFIILDDLAQSTIDPILTWVIVEGDTEKSDPVTLYISQIITPPGFFDQCHFYVYQHEWYSDAWNAGLVFTADTKESEDFGYWFRLQFTGQGSIAAHMPENPMFGDSADFPHLWEAAPYVPVSPPYGTARFVIGGHINDSRYYFGPPFSVSYEEEYRMGKFWIIISLSNKKGW
jgi:hypothetical protein